MAGDPVITARLDWGCGPIVAAHDEWVTSDESEYVQSLPFREPDHIGRIQDGLPWQDGAFEYVVSHHALMMLTEAELVPALVELRRVTMPGGWLRVSVPDMDQAIYAYLHGNRGWFPLDAPTAGVAFCRYVTQNGATRSVFTQPRLAHLLADSGWTQWQPVAYHVTGSGLPGIIELDSRPGESMFMEARCASA